MPLEIVHLDTEGEFVECQCALDDTLAVPFLFHKSVRDNFSNELAFFNYLERQTKLMLDLYGDARKWPERGFQQLDHNPHEA